MAQGIPNENIFQALQLNETWTGTGRHGESPLTEAEKFTVARKIAADLRAVENDHGKDFLEELWAGNSREGYEWAGLRSWLLTVDWFARDYRSGKINPFLVWAVLKKKAMKKAQKCVLSKKPVLVEKAISQALESLI